MDPPEDVDLDLGDGHLLVWSTMRDGTVRWGASIYHPHLKQPGEWCASGIVWVTLQGDTGPVWTLEGNADSHITVSPSLRCLRCGDHGFIQNGRWVKAG